MNARVQELEQSIVRHSDLYYNGDPEISDAAFDTLVDELRRLSPASSVLKKVGAKPQAALVWPEAKHEIPMGSQMKVNSIEEFLEWARGTGSEWFCWSEKLDGSSLAVKHVGAVALAISRGDGTTGSDITPNARKMNIGNILNTSASFWLRGEVIMKRSTFDAKYKGVFKNPRNAAAGMARRLDGQGCDDLGILVYDAHGVEFETEFEKFQWLESCGFFTPAYGLVHRDDVARVYQEYIDREREECPFEIDGLIIAVNHLKTQRALGVTDGRPKGQRALKFPSLEKETRILAVTWQTGRTGRITPVAEIEPTDIGGVTISRVTLDSAAMVEELNIEIGCRVMLRRANDVIPKIMRRL